MLGSPVTVPLGNSLLVSMMGVAVIVLWFAGSVVSAVEFAGIWRKSPMARKVSAIISLTGLVSLPLLLLSAPLIGMGLSFIADALIIAFAASVFLAPAAYLAVYAYRRFPDGKLAIASAVLYTLQIVWLFIYWLIRFVVARP